MSAPDQATGVQEPDGTVRLVRTSADPTPEETAAIVAAVEVAWPRPVVAAAPEQPPRWRFAGRWWSKPVPARRERPW